MNTFNIWICFLLNIHLPAGKISINPFRAYAHLYLIDFQYSAAWDGLTFRKYGFVRRIVRWRPANRCGFPSWYFLLRRHSSVFIANFKQISHIVLLVLLLTFNAGWGLIRSTFLVFLFFSSFFQGLRNLWITSVNCSKVLLNHHFYRSPQQILLVPLHSLIIKTLFNLHTCPIVNCPISS